MGRASLSLTLALIGCAVLSAQSPPTPAFEVASIKPNKSVGAFSMLGAVQPGGRFTMTNVSVRDMIGLAYRLRDFQILGGPSWAMSDRFDVLAKAAEELRPPPAPWSADASSSVVFAMLQSLLAERFRLTVHKEVKETGVYALLVNRSDGKLGPQLKPSTVDCDALHAARARSVPAGPPPPPPPPPQPGDPPPPCVSGGGRGGYLFGGSVPLAALTQALSRVVDRPVVDKTGLSGNFDFTLVFAADQPSSILSPPPPAPPLAAIANAPMLPTALQEQLGLKLESERAPVDYLVIDRVEQPTEN
ncbi:MAG TPA: TIGR03435 family protein [Vicinamibacterales bacterium]